MSLKLSEIIQYALLHSGQYIVSPDYNLDEFLLSNDAFFLLARHEIEEYADYIPHTWSKNLYIQKTHIFTPVLSEPVPGKPQYVVEPIPQWISSVTPVELYSTPAMALLFRGVLSPGQMSNQERVDPRPPATWVWKYEKPKLWLPYQGNVDVTMHSKYTFIEDRATGGKLRDVEWPNLDYEADLIDRVTGRFMMTLGRSRRAFMLTDIPVQVDADALVSEGKELYEASCQHIIDRSYTHLSLGN